MPEQGVALARSAFRDRGRPGTVFKYFNGSWDEPGLGGRVTPIFSTSTGWKGPRVEAFWGPSVHWNEYLGMYVALLNRTDGPGWAQEAVYITFSEDLLQWTEPRQLIDTPHWYPQVLGVGPHETDNRTGASARLYVGGASAMVIEFGRPTVDPVRGGS